MTARVSCHSEFLCAREKILGTDPLVTPADIAGVTGDFVVIGTRPAHARDGHIQCLKHRLWWSSGIHRTVVTVVIYVPCALMHAGTYQTL